ncbi:MAG: hypothetical protein KJ589_17235 [Proteobacteria bacterium]|nr:hypothetical protein [Pseudomonadota bacterium]
MNDQNVDKYEILRGLALAGQSRQGLTKAAEAALRQASELVGLQAAAVYLWDEGLKVTLTASHARTETSRERLVSLEEDLFQSLRKDSHVLSAYITIGGDIPLHSFTQPLRRGDHIFGAVVGIQEGERTIVYEDAFLEAFSALLSLNVVADGLSGDEASTLDDLNKARLSAVTETAVTVNHEINNPLTAILGNVQLLLLKRSDLDEELAAKLRTIETSALKIRDVTQRLLHITSFRSVPYADGTSMLDLSDDAEEPPE